MTVNFTTTQQKVVFTDTDGAVTFTAATAPVVFTAAVAGPQGPAGAGLTAEWAMHRQDTSGAIPAVDADPVGDLAGWEAAGGPAYWSIADGDRVAYRDDIDRTQSGVYLYTAGVSFTRTADADTTAKLHNMVVSSRLARDHVDGSAWSTPAFTTSLVVFVADDPTQPLGTATWRPYWHTDARTFDRYTLGHISDTTAAHAASAIAVTASGFNGHLATSDDTVQKVAQKVDDLTFQGVGVALRGSFFGASGNYTMGNDDALVYIIGSVGTITLPDGLSNLGKKYVIYNSSGSNLTIAAAGSDFFPIGTPTPSDGSSVTLVPVDAGFGVGLWLAVDFAGRDVDIPAWNGLGFADGKVVQMVSGAPAWSEVTAGEVTYSASTSADWAGSPPSAPSTALDTLAARTVAPGYISNQGGTVTQTTNKQTTVTLNTRCGTITTHDESMTPNLRKHFVVTNSTVTALDTIVLSLQYDGAHLDYFYHEVRIVYVTDGEFCIQIWNYDTSNTYSVPLTINFAIIAGDN